MVSSAIEKGQPKLTHWDSARYAAIYSYSVSLASGKE